MDFTIARPIRWPWCLIEVTGVVRGSIKRDAGETSVTKATTASTKSVHPDLSEPILEEGTQPRYKRSYKFSKGFSVILSSGQDYCGCWCRN
jgi:hypothetical protein